MLPYSFLNFKMVLSHLSKLSPSFPKIRWCTQALALALLVPGAGGDVIIDGDTIDIDGVIRAALQERAD